MKKKSDCGNPSHKFSDTPNAFINLLGISRQRSQKLAVTDLWLPPEYQFMLN